MPTPQLTPVVLGLSLGGVAAVLAYGAVAPVEDDPRASVRVAPSRPVPTPTRTVLADCSVPARLERGVCVTHVPGADRVVVDPVPAAPAGPIAPAVPEPLPPRQAAPRVASRPPAAGPVRPPHADRDEDEAQASEHEADEQDREHGDD